MKISEKGIEPPLAEGKGLELMFETVEDVRVLELDKTDFNEFNRFQSIVLKSMLSLTRGFDNYEILVRDIVDSEGGQYNLDSMKNNILELNEELASTINILLVLSKVTNIEADDIFRYYEKELKEANLHEAYLFNNNTLKTLVSFARHCNITDDNIGLQHTSYRFDFSGNLNKPFSHAGRLIGPELYCIAKQQLWDIINQYGKLLNLANTRDTQKIQEKMMDIWQLTFKYFDLMGCTEESIFENHYLKYKCN